MGAAACSLPPAPLLAKLPLATRGIAVGHKEELLGVSSGGELGQGAGPTSGSRGVPVRSMSLGREWTGGLLLSPFCP